MARRKDLEDSTFIPQEPRSSNSKDGIEDMRYVNSNTGQQPSTRKLMDSIRELG